MNKLLRLVNTLKYLKPIQVYYRLYYLVRRRVRSLGRFRYPMYLASNTATLTLQPSIESYPSQKHNDFTFLNLSHTFANDIDWNYSEYGKLWTYNLTYFDYLQQEEVTKEDGLRLIHNFITQAENHKDALEPFPISLRGINWIKFLTAYNVREQTIDNNLYAQYMILLDNLEYHLLGNHLLENGFSLLFGAYYFHDERLYAKAIEILKSELDEQILDDGAHFERSPMYHQIMLFRVIDCLNLVKNNPWMDDSGCLMELFEIKAKKMLAWLNVMTFENGDIPLFNDSARGIAPTTKQLNDYASRLDLNHQPSTINHSLSTSGYRKITKPRYECIVDIGQIGPDYIPGHAHADTFSFELYIDGKPFVVDTGLSTYETNERRTVERSTVSHNTVEVEGLDQSEVWGGFRVADRAYVTQLEEEDNKIKAAHDGYNKRLGAMHQREFLFGEERVQILDTIVSDKELQGIARLHFHPDVVVEVIEGGVSAGNVHILTGESDLELVRYEYAPEFNKRVQAKMLEIKCIKKLRVEIVL